MSCPPASGDASADATEVVGACWRKSSFSGPTGGNCVETAVLAVGRVAVRNSRFPAGPVLIFPAGPWQTFLGHCRTARTGGQL